MLCFTAGTLSAENRVVDSSRTVIFTCQTICGKLQWHLNGRIVSEGSQNELYKVTQVYSTCSASFSPQCVQCGCNNCHDIQYQSSQTYTSNISITVYGNFVLSCMSILSYPHQQYIVLRKTYNVDVAHESKILWLLCCMRVEIISLHVATCKIIHLFNLFNLLLLSCIFSTCRYSFYKFN